MKIQMNIVMRHGTASFSSTIYKILYEFINKKTNFSLCGNPVNHTRGCFSIYWTVFRNEMNETFSAAAGNSAFCKNINYWTINM